MSESADARGYHHGSLSAALTTAALELLDEEGLDRVTVREVARRVGVSSAAPFRHFADRRALLAAVADAVLADFRQWQADAVAAADGSGFRAFGSAFVRYAAAHPNRFALLRSAVYRQGDPDEQRAGAAEFGRYATELVVAGQRAGELRAEDPMMVTLAGHALVYGLSQMIVDGFVSSDQADEVVERVLDVFSRGVAATPDS